MLRYSTRNIKFSTGTLKTNLFQVEWYIFHLWYEIDFKNDFEK